MRLKQAKKNGSLPDKRVSFEPKKQRNITRLDGVRFFNPFCKLSSINPISPENSMNVKIKVSVMP